MGIQPTTYTGIADWAQEEMSGAAFGDRRYQQRSALLLTRMTQEAGKSMPDLFNWNGLRGAYRLLSSPAVRREEIIASHAEQTARRARRCKVVLALQDTTELNYSHLRETTGLGYISHKDVAGLLVHSCLLVTPERVPLGLIDQQIWARPSSKKESTKWLPAFGRVAELLAETSQVVVVGDRESDIFDVLAQARPAHVELLVRSLHDRATVVEGKRMKQVVAESAELGRTTLEVTAHANRRARTAELSIRAASVEVRRPQRSKVSSSVQSVRVQVIHVQELSPPGQEKAIEWVLVTSLEVSDLEDALRIVEYYSCRWLIERFHYTLKSGCGIEKSQLRSSERLERLIAMSSIVAWRLMWLSYLSRSSPEAPVDQILSRIEWVTLVLWAKKEGLTRQTTAPSVGQAVSWLGRLGGHLGRKNDGPPGVKVLWRGFQRLSQMAQMYTILKETDQQSIGNT